MGACYLAGMGESSTMKKTGCKRMCRDECNKASIIGHATASLAISSRIQEAPKVPKELGIIVVAVIRCEDWKRASLAMRSAVVS